MGVSLSASEGRRLIGRVAIVTGGAHGIGRAYCLRFAAEGAAVAVFDLDEPAAKALAEEILAAGGSALAVRVDVTDESAIEAGVAEVVRAFGGVDVLVNNAAMFSVVPMSRDHFDTLSVKEWDKMMEINVKGAWLMCRAVVPRLRERHGGKIINISSGTAFKGTSSQIHYVTSKAALLGFTRTLARELGGDAINVNAIAPGSTLSEEEVDDETVRRRSGVVPTRALQRLETPDDLVGAAVFLASGDSDFVTGQTIVVDGGAVMR